jgi:hypothetical protein
MRVSLQYSVDLEDVPEHVIDLIDNEWDNISFCDHLINECMEILKAEDPSIGSSLKKIDRVRKMLGRIDLRLSECESILKGYEKAIQPPPPQPTANPESNYEKYNTPYEVPKESTK